MKILLKTEIAGWLIMDWLNLIEAKRRKKFVITARISKQLFSFSFFGGFCFFCSSRIFVNVADGRHLVKLPVLIN